MTAAFPCQGLVCDSDIAWLSDWFMTVEFPGQETGLLQWHFLIRYWFVAIALMVSDWFSTVAIIGQETGF